MRLSRTTPLALAAALALASACGSDVGDAGDLAARDLGIGDLASADLGDCPSSSHSNGGPTVAGACTSYGQRCHYFESYCDCNQQERLWICCWNGVLVDCPSTAPTPGTRCCDQYVTATCAYACAGGVASTCRCVDDHWQCATAACD